MKKKDNWKFEGVETKGCGNCKYIIFLIDGDGQKEPCKSCTRL